jgi:hypothetical protein
VVKPLHLSAAVVFVATVLLTYGALSKEWVSTSDTYSSARAGLRSFEICDGEEPCKSMSFEEIGTNVNTRDTVMVWAGKFSFGLGLVGALASALCGILFLSSKRNVGAVVVIGLGVAALAGALTFLIAIQPGVGSLSRGLGSYAYLAGASLMIIGGAIAVSKKDVAARQAAVLGAAPALQGSVITGTVPACPHCLAPTDWVAEHQRFFCSRCRVYV